MRCSDWKLALAVCDTAIQGGCQEGRRSGGTSCGAQRRAASAKFCQHTVNATQALKSRKAEQGSTRLIAWALVRVAAQRQRSVRLLYLCLCQDYRL